MAPEIEPDEQYGLEPDAPEVEIDADDPAWAMPVEGGEEA